MAYCQPAWRAHSVNASHPTRISFRIKTFHASRLTSDVYEIAVEYRQLSKKRPEYGRLWGGLEPVLLSLSCSNRFLFHTIHRAAVAGVHQHRCTNPQHDQEAQRQ